MNNEYTLPLKKINYPAMALFHPAIVNLPNPHANFFTFLVGNMDAERKYVFNRKTIMILMKVKNVQSVQRYIRELEEQKFIKDITKEVGAKIGVYVIKVLDEKNWGYKPEVKLAKKDQASIVAEIIDELSPESLEHARIHKLDQIETEEFEIARINSPFGFEPGQNIEIKKKVILRWHSAGLLKGQTDELDSIVNRVIRNELPFYRLDKGKIKFDRDHRTNMTALDLLERAFTLAKEPSITANPEKHRIYLKSVLQKMYPSFTEEQIKVKVNAFIEARLDKIKNSNPVVMEIPRDKITEVTPIQARPATPADEEIEKLKKANEKLQAELALIRKQNLKVVEVNTEKDLLIAGQKNLLKFNNHEVQSKIFKKIKFEEVFDVEEETYYRTTLPKSLLYPISLVRVPENDEEFEMFMNMNFVKDLQIVCAIKARTYLKQAKKELVNTEYEKFLTKYAQVPEKIVKIFIIIKRFPTISEETLGFYLTHWEAFNWTDEVVGLKEDQITAPEVKMLPMGFKNPEVSTEVSDKERLLDLGFGLAADVVTDPKVLREMILYVSSAKNITSMTDFDLLKKFGIKF